MRAFHGHRAALGIGDLEREAVAVVARSDRHVELRSRLRLGARTHFALQHHAFAALLVRNDIRIDLLGRGIGYVVVLGQVRGCSGATLPVMLRTGEVSSTCSITTPSSAA